MTQKSRICAQISHVAVVNFTLHQLSGRTFGAQGVRTEDCTVVRVTLLCMALHVPPADPRGQRPSRSKFFASQILHKIFVSTQRHPGSVGVLSDCTIVGAVHLLHTGATGLSNTENEARFRPAESGLCVFFIFRFILCLCAVRFSRDMKIWGQILIALWKRSRLLRIGTCVARPVLKLLGLSFW